MNNDHQKSETFSKYAMISPLSTLLFGDWRDLTTQPAPQGDYLIGEDQHHIYFEANAPGVRADEIEVMLERDTLTVKAQTPKNQEVDKSPFANRLRSYYYRAKLPKEIDASREPQATYRDGVILIAFKKRQTELPKKILIES